MFKYAIIFIVWKSLLVFTLQNETLSPTFVSLTFHATTATPSTVQILKYNKNCFRRKPGHHVKRQDTSTFWGIYLQFHFTYLRSSTQEYSTLPIPLVFHPECWSLSWNLGSAARDSVPLRFSVPQQLSHRVRGWRSLDISVQNKILIDFFFFLIILYQFTVLDFFNIKKFSYWGTLLLLTPTLWTLDRLVTTDLVIDFTYNIRSGVKRVWHSMFLKYFIFLKLEPIILLLILLPDEQKLIGTSKLYCVCN